MNDHQRFELNPFEALFRHATIGIIVTDEEGKIVIVNHQAEAQFGYSEDELKGMTVDILVPAAKRGIHQDHRNRFYQLPSPRRMGEGRDLFAQHKLGTSFPVEISLSSYKSEGQLYVIAFVIDITVRKNQEEILLQQKKELESITSEILKLNSILEDKVKARTMMLQETLGALEKSKEELSEALAAEKEVGELKSRFVTMASHEFRTPLSTILSSAYLIEKYAEREPGGKIGKHVARIKTAVADMKNILEDFLSLGKLEEGTIQANMQLVPAEQCGDEVAHGLQEMEPILKAGQRIEFIRGGEGQLMVDRHLLKNILLNLVSNAIKFSPENTCIQVACHFSANSFTMAVSDKGIGISDEDRQRLFTRFFRGKNATNIQGTGLGLHIVAKYLELMGGYIEVHSALNEGTKFTIHIPQQVNHN